MLRWSYIVLLLVGGAACNTAPILVGDTDVGTSGAVGGSTAQGSSSSGSTTAMASSTGATAVSSTGHSSTAASTATGAAGSSTSGTTGSAGGGTSASSSGGTGGQPDGGCGTNYTECGDGGSLYCCNGVCVDLSSDSNNCHDCGTQCPAQSGETCVDYACVVDSCVGVTDDDSDFPCQADAGVIGVCCQQRCVDEQSDSSSCGYCGASCEVGSTCALVSSNIECTFADGGLAWCDGGGCGPGQVCDSEVGLCLTASCDSAMQGEVCSMSATLDPEQRGIGVCCGSTCADPTYDPNNCGGCGNVCQSDQYCGYVFAEGYSCLYLFDCPTNNSCFLPDAGRFGACCGDACPDVQSDNQNCGGCNQICPQGSSCVAGLCTLADGGVACRGPECLPRTCSAEESGVPCIAPTGVEGLCCAGACVDDALDPNNCGACGNACASGVCVQAANGLLGYQCFPLSDAGCSMGCDDPSAVCLGNQCYSSSDGCGNADYGSVCVASAGALDVGVCCALTFSTSTCTNPTSDPANCGGCGLTCDPGQTCSYGVCSGVQAPCGAAQEGRSCPVTDDAGTCCAAGCMNLQSDPLNCGRCGNNCTGYYSDDPVCVAGACYGGCDGTWSGDCYAPGVGIGYCCGRSCLTDFGDDPNNCGGCGVVCRNGETCSDANCALNSCTAQTAGDACHLDGGAAGTCCSAACADTLSDPDNCGGCGFGCSGSCVNGACQ